MVNRPGKGQLGCLMMLLIVSTVGYFAVTAGQSYWNYVQLQDRMKQEARFAAHRSDGAIRRRLEAFADSIGLPEQARKIKVRRRGQTIEIWTEYYEHIELPGYVKEFHFHPQAVSTF